MTEFTPFESLAGGLLIGLSAVLMMIGNGRITGISGIVSGVMPPVDWPGLVTRIAFIVGLVIAPLVYQFALHKSVIQTVPSNVALMVAAGLLVGFGSILGSGCTSGHGVCGLSRFSMRSLAATASFMLSGIVTVAIIRHVLGG